MISVRCCCYETSDYRSEILDVLLRKMKHSLSTDQKCSIAHKLHGFVGADMSALCAEAGMHTIRRTIQVTD